MELLVRTSFYFVELCSLFISFFPRRYWETETGWISIKCSTVAHTASLTWTSHKSAINHAFSYGLQLCKPTVWRASRISASPRPPRDDLSPIWVACAPNSLWFARWASIVALYLNTTEPDFSLSGILAAVFWFPFGIGLCLLDRRVRCHRCGLIIEDGVCG